MPSILRPRRWPGALVALAVLLAAPARAQWDPPNGQWGKVEALDVRLVTWNVKDGLCSSNAKVEGQNNWCATARIVAALRPDVLLLQECGDNSGNGTGSGVDSVGVLTNVMSLFFVGGTDPYQGGTITAYVQKYAPGYALPHVYVTGETDGYNRNVILSRFPLADLNGDTKSAVSDIPWVTPDLYAPGGDGGLRGFQFAELDLPDAEYAGDLVVGNAHLKAGGGGSDHDQRVEAARNVAYVIDYWFNGASAGTPDPRGKIGDSPPATSVLGPETPVVIGGDWNEDESTNGTKGPAEWLCRAQQTGGTDGTDRDRTDMTRDSATHYFTGSDHTIGGSKLDYLAWQDSLTLPRLQTLFESGGTPSGSLPPEVVGFPNPTTISSQASDHRPVLVDLVLPGACPAPIAYCVGAPNSVGSGASIHWYGSYVHAANDFHLLAQSTVPNQFGLFFYGPAQIQVPFGDGWRCVGSGGVGTFRLNPPGLSDFFGDAERHVDFTQPPASVGPAKITAGSTWNFQYWYRDPAGPGGNGFNLTGGLSVTFCP